MAGKTGFFMVRDVHESGGASLDYGPWRGPFCAHEIESAIRVNLLDAYARVELKRFEAWDGTGVYGVGYLGLQLQGTEERPNVER